MKKITNIFRVVMRKKICYLFTLLLIFSSCKYEKFDEAELIFNESLSLRITIQVIKKIEKLGVINENNSRESIINSSLNLCFDFKYPITIQYNNNTNITVNSFSHLVQLILTETPQVHMNSIEYPFTVIMNDSNNESIISNENSFDNLIETCGYGTLAFEEIKDAYGSCFDFNYPISVIINGQTYNFNSESDAIALSAAFNQEVKSFNFIYPFSIKKNNQNINIPDYFTLTTIIAGCN